VRSLARVPTLVAPDEVLATGGSLDRYDLTDEERAEAHAKAPEFWRKSLGGQSDQNDK
jgi:hypothetical protein